MHVQQPSFWLKVTVAVLMGCLGGCDGCRTIRSWFGKKEVARERAKQALCATDPYDVVLERLRGLPASSTGERPRQPEIDPQKYPLGAMRRQQLNKMSEGSTHGNL